MPLLTGNWRLFVGGPEETLGITDLQPSGNFAASVGPALVLHLFPALGGAAGPLGMSGRGFWNEVGQAIAFSLRFNMPPLGHQNLLFTGYQVQPPGGADPAQDVVWTLAGEFQHVSGIGAPQTVLPDESARRFVFGWYAQITQVI